MKNVTDGAWKKIFKIQVIDWLLTHKSRGLKCDYEADFLTEKLFSYLSSLHFLFKKLLCTEYYTYFWTSSGSEGLFFAVELF